jgi:hypothetical protein
MSLKRDAEARLGNIFLGAIKIFDLSLRLSASGFILLRPKWLFEVAISLEIISTCFTIEFDRKSFADLLLALATITTGPCNQITEGITRRTLRGF